MKFPHYCIHVFRTDGADLLQLSVLYNVHISLTFNPLALRVEGLRGSLKGLTEHVSSLKKVQFLVLHIHASFKPFLPRVSLMRYLSFQQVVPSGQICCNAYLGYLARTSRIMVTEARYAFAIKVCEPLLIVIQVRICAKDLSDITAAERLALRASLEVSVFSNSDMGLGYIGFIGWDTSAHRLLRST